MNPRITQMILPLAAAILISAVSPALASAPILLGPPNSGASSGGADWLSGANGAGYTLVDFDDPPTDGFDFTISNTVAGKENTADWRPLPFSLGPAAGGARPITFTFAYKLMDAVARNDNILVQLRFFDATGTNFVSQIVVRVGAHTGDSSMTVYKTRIIENIIVPRQARTADIWVDANIFEPWVSGTARFGDFSVTTAPRSPLFKLVVIVTALVGMYGFTSLFIFLWRRRARPKNEK